MFPPPLIVQKPAETSLFPGIRKRENERLLKQSQCGFRPRFLGERKMTPLKSNIFLLPMNCNRNLYISHTVHNDFKQTLRSKNVSSSQPIKMNDLIRLAQDVFFGQCHVQPNWNSSVSEICAVYQDLLIRRGPRNLQSESILNLERVKYITNHGVA